MSSEPVHLYAALIDVLAYRHHLEGDRRSGDLRFQNQLSSALSVFDDVNDAVFGVQAISDTIILTCSEHAHFPEFLRILRTVFVGFLKEGLFIRGGIAFSRHFQSGRLTYSHAIARAYELESSLASYPRIVLDNNIIEMYQVGDNLPKINNCGFLCMENGVHFLDVLTEQNWHEVYEYASRIYADSRAALQLSESAFTKHLRFEKYLFESLHAPNDPVAYVTGVQTN